jgi:hypothetical protein
MRLLEEVAAKERTQWQVIWGKCVYVANRFSREH